MRVSLQQHSTAQPSTAQHSTAQHSTAQHSTAQHSTAQHSTAQHSTAQHKVMAHSLTQGRVTLWKATRRGRPVKHLLLGSNQIPHSCQSLQARSSHAFWSSPCRWSAPHSHQQGSTCHTIIRFAGHKIDNQNMLLQLHMHLQQHALLFLKHAG